MRSNRTPASDCNVRWQRRKPDETFHGDTCHLDAPAGQGPVNKGRRQASDPGGVTSRERPALLQICMIHRSQIQPGDLIEYRGIVRSVPSDPAQSVRIKTDRSHGVGRDVDLRPRGDAIPDDQCPDCAERPTRCLHGRDQRKIPLFYCCMCAKSYEPKGPPIMEPA